MLQSVLQTEVFSILFLELITETLMGYFPGTVCGMVSNIKKAELAPKSKKFNLLYRKKRKFRFYQ